MRDDANVRLIDPHRDDHGWLAHSTGDLGLAISELEDALETDRGHPDALLLLANRLLRTGQTRCARPVIDHVMAVDPLTPLTRCMPGFFDAMDGGFEAAGTSRRRLERGENLGARGHLEAATLGEVGGDEAHQHAPELL